MLLVGRRMKGGRGRAGRIWRWGGGEKNRMSGDQRHKLTVLASVLSFLLLSKIPCCSSFKMSIKLEHTFLLHRLLSRLFHARNMPFTPFMPRPYIPSYYILSHPVLHHSLVTQPSLKLCLLHPVCARLSHLIEFCHFTLHSTS